MTLIIFITNYYVLVSFHVVEVPSAERDLNDEDGHSISDESDSSWITASESRGEIPDLKVYFFLLWEPQLLLYQDKDRSMVPKKNAQIPSAYLT